MEERVFNKQCWKNWTIAHKNVNLEYSLTLCTKTQNGLKDLNVRLGTIQLLEENIGKWYQSEWHHQKIHKQ